MISIRSLAATLAILASASADVCNPLESNGCSPDEALGTDVAYDFSLKPLDWTITTFPNRFSFDAENGMTLTLAERLDNPSIRSNYYLMFGRVEAHIQAAPGRGIISSFFLQSDDLDEVDVELVGSDDTEWQSNFFSKGITGNFDRGAFHPTTGNPTTNTFNYTILWTEESVQWWFEGSLIRTLLSTDPKGFPQSPMRIFIGLWAGGDPLNAPGTIQWAGGETDYSQAPFQQRVRLLVANDFSTGKEYKYGDQLGSWQSIEAVDGKVNGRVNGWNPKPALNQKGLAESFSSESPSSSSTQATSSSTQASSSSSSSSTMSSSSSKPASSSKPVSLSMTSSSSQSKASSSPSSVVAKSSTTAPSSKPLSTLVTSTMSSSSSVSSESKSSLRPSNGAGAIECGSSLFAVALAAMALL